MLTINVAVFAVLSAAARCRRPQPATDSSPSAALSISFWWLLLCYILQGIAQEMEQSSTHAAHSKHCDYYSFARGVTAVLLRLLCVVVVGITGAVMTLQFFSVFGSTLERSTEMRKDWKYLVDGLEEYERRRSMAWNA